MGYCDSAMVRISFSAGARDAAVSRDVPYSGSSPPPLAVPVLDLIAQVFKIFLELLQIMSRAEALVRGLVRIAALHLNAAQRRIEIEHKRSPVATLLGSDPDLLGAYFIDRYALRLLTFAFGQ